MNTSCCRICLDTKKPNQMKSIFEDNIKDEINPSIPEIVFMLCGIQISESDDNSKIICKSCLDDVSTIRKFRNQCISSDNYFKIWTGSSEPTTLKDKVKQETENSDYFEIEPEQHYLNKKITVSKARNKKVDRSRTSKTKAKPVKKIVIENERLPCSICGKICRSTRLLYSHEKTHEKKPDKKDFLCDHCGKEFALKIYLYAHMINVHIQEKKYKCDKCPAAYSRIDSYKNHIAQHMTVKPIACSQCPKTFGSRKHYLTHQRVHSGERPFQCKLMHKLS